MIDENLMGLLVFLTDFSSEFSRSSFKFHFSSLAPPSLSASNGILSESMIYMSIRERETLS